MNRMAASLALALALAGPPAQAAFEDLGAGARAPGLGNAFTALADDVYAVYYNPAGLAQLERPQFSTAYSRLFMGLSDGTNLNAMQLVYAHPLQKGRYGTLGLGYSRFAASDLYYEQTIHLSYGRLMWQTDEGSRLLGGLSLKQLKHGFGAPPEAANACNGTNCTNGPDPVLSGQNAKSAYDADLGFVYRFPRRFQIGLAAHHVMRPDVGFAGPDKLPMSLRGGAAYKTLWLSLMGELRQEQGPTGSQDREIVVAGERIFPTLTAGQFGLRGSLGFGTRDFEQITAGLSYRINKIQLDYAFLMPLGTVKGTAGTHRVSFGWHFGAPTPDEEITQDLLDQARQLREGRGPSYGYEYAEELRPHDLEDPRLAGVRRLIEARLYRQAHEALARFVAGQVPKAPLVRLTNRLELVAHHYPDWSGPREKWENFGVSAIDNFLHGRDRKAILKASYALSLSPNDAKFEHFLANMETAVGIKAERLPADHPRSFIEEMLYRVEAANARNDLQKVQLLLQDILDLDPENVIAMERVGSMYYVLGHYQDAIDTWNTALALETRPTEIENLKRHIQLAWERLGGKAPAGTAAPQAQLPGAAAPAAAPQAQLPGTAARAAAAPQPAPAPQPAAKPAQPPAEARRGDARDVERLFQKGVEHYARGEYLQATAMFMRILQIDPENAQARKALERLENKAPR